MFGVRGSPKVDSTSPFGSLDSCTKFGGVLVVVLGSGQKAAIRLTENLRTDLWWLSHQDSNRTAARNPGLLVR